MLYFFGIQSSAYTTEELEQRTQDFLKDLCKNPSLYLSENQFAQMKAAALEELNSSPKNGKLVAIEKFKEAFFLQENFHSKKDLREEVEKITYADLCQEIQEKFSQTNPEKVSICIDYAPIVHKEEEDLSNGTFP